MKNLIKQLLINIATQFEHDFFMNWLSNKVGKDYEYSILIIGLALIVIINGSGQWSIDGLSFKK